jgi:cytochrome c oxidase assembly protein subunit 15
MHADPHSPAAPTDRPGATPAFRPWPHRVAVAAAAVTWPLLLLGGTVTVLRAGMAVPDWPTTFGINMFLFNMFEATWGVFVEHGHRLYGSALGLACVALACWYTIDRLGARALGIVAAALVLLAVAVSAPSGVLGGRDAAVLAAIGTLGIGGLALAAYFGAARRDLQLGLAWLVLAGVVGQGVLGGKRVNLNAADLAFVHGCTAQAFFALTIALAVVSGRRWSEAAGRARPTAPAGLRPLAAVAVPLVYAQVVLGANVRHYLGTAGLVAHAVAAVAVVAVAAALAALVFRHRRGAAALVPSARALAALTVLQVALGVANWWTHPPFDGVPRPRELTPGVAAVRLGHQGLGALVLAASVVLALRAFRHLASPAPEGAGLAANPPARRSLEPVA